MSILMFPGQGSKSSLGLDNRVSKEINNIATEILGYDVFQLTEEQLQDTRYSQVEIFIKSMIVFKMHEQSFGQIHSVVGHSLGQYTACVVAGGLTFEVGLNLIQQRGILMSECAKSHPGSMLACIGKDLDIILPSLLSNCKNIYEANYNSANQIVISGDRDEIDKFADLCKANSVKNIKLAVAGAFHSPLMSKANDSMNQLLEKVQFMDPKYPFISNKMQSLIHTADELRREFIDQIILPVYWTQISHFISKQGEKIYEVSTAKILSRLLETETGIKVSDI